MMAWQGQIPIEVGGVPLESSLGPAMIGSFNQILIAFQEYGGTKLFTANCDGSMAVFSTWAGNSQIVTSSGQHLDTSDRPAINVPFNVPIIVFVNLAGAVVTTSLNFGVWSDPVAVSDFSTKSHGWRSPSLMPAGRKMVLFVTDSSERAWYSFQVLEISRQLTFKLTPWTPARQFPPPPLAPLQGRGIGWFVATHKNKYNVFVETVFAVTRTEIHIYESQLVYDPVNEPNWIYRGAIPFLNRHATIASTSSGSTIFFTPAHNDFLHSAIIDPDTLTVGSISAPIAANFPLATNQTPYAIVSQSFNTPHPFDSLCVAFKQAGGHDLCFAYQNI